MRKRIKKFGARRILTIVAALFAVGAGVTVLHFSLAGNTGAAHTASLPTPSVSTSDSASPAPAAASSQPSSTPARDVTEISFLAAGDNLIHNTVYWDANKYAGGKGYSFTQMYEDIRKDVGQSDFAFVNQETILGGTGMGLSSYPAFNSPQEVGDALRQLGFNLISEANNHSLDKGFKGIKSACDYWQGKPAVITAGIYETQADSEKISVIEKKGVKVALIAGTWFTNGISKPSGKAWCVETDFNDILAKAKAARSLADVVVVSMHWGVEYSNKPNSEQQQQAQQLADAGADIIIGNHPHVIQKVEWLNSAGGRRSIVAYAMGNFISNQSEFRNMVGGMLELKITLSGGRATLHDARFVPVVTCFGPGSNNFRVYKLSDYTQSIASQHALEKKGIDMSPARVRTYVKGIIGPEFYS